MERKKRRAHALLAALLALVLSGCSASPLLGSNVEELLRAPQTGQLQSAVHKALSSFLGETPQLKYPRGGDEMDPMQIGDLDGDGQDEVAVLYTAEGKGKNVHLAVLEAGEDGAWQVADEAEGLSTEVAALARRSFLPQGTQLAVGYANSNLGDKYLALYQYADGRLSVLYRQAYDQFLAEDVTADGRADLAVVGQAGQPGAMTMQLWTLQEGVFGPVQTVTFDESLVGCAGLYLTRYGDERGIIVDGVLSSGRYAVTVLCMQNGRLFLWPQGKGEEVLAQTARAVQELAPRDLVGNGTVYVAQVRKTVSALEGARRLYLVEWYNYLLPVLPFERFGVYDSATGLFMRLPSVWRDRVDVDASAADGSWQMRRIEDGQLLLSVRTADADEEPGIYEQIAVREGVRVLVYFGTGCTDNEREQIRTGAQYLD